MADAMCPHKTLKKQIEPMSKREWYKCLDCRQKFKAVEWDGRVKVVTGGQRDDQAQG